MNAAPAGCSDFEERLYASCTGGDAADAPLAAHLAACAECRRTRDALLGTVDALRGAFATRGESEGLLDPAPEPAGAAADVGRPARSGRLPAILRAAALVGCAVAALWAAFRASSGDDEFPEPAPGATRYVAEDALRECATPAGALIVDGRRGRAVVDVNSEFARTGAALGAESDMKAATAIVTVAVLAGAAWWKADGESQAIPAGTVATRSEASSRPGAVVRDATPAPEGGGSVASAAFKEPESAPESAPTAGAPPAVATRDVRVRALDPAGAAVPGCFVNTRFGKFGPGGADGVVVAKIPVGAAVDGAGVVARDFLLTTWSCAADADAVDVSLRRAGSFHVRIVAADGGPGKDLLVRVWAPKGALPNPGAALITADVGGTTSWTTQADGDGSLVVAYRTDERGEALLLGYEEGVEVRLQVLDRFGHPIEEVQAIAVHRPQPTVVTLRAALRTLTVRVGDADGAPVPQAVVVFIYKSLLAGSYLRARVEFVADASGTVTIPNVYGANSDLRVTRRGFAPLFVNDWAFPPAGEVAVVKMEKGRDVRVRVLGGDGKPVEAEWVRAWPEGCDDDTALELHDYAGKTAGFSGNPWNGVTGADGVVVLRDLPRGVGFTAAAQGVNAPAPYRGGPDETEFEIRYAATGSVRMVLRSAAKGEHWVRLCEPGGQRKSVADKLLPEVRADETVVFDSVPAGDYVLTVLRVGDGGGATAHGPRKVRVEAGATAEVDF
jgi:hypothetical protein